MPSQEDNVKAIINMSLLALKKYEWLLELYVLDFFVDNHWEKLPISWQSCFRNIDPQELGNIISGKRTKHMLPLTFIALHKTVTSLSLPRHQNKDNINVEDIKFRNLFLKHVKLKKRHEINSMSCIVSKTAKQNQCNNVVDFGSGLGHLVRILSYQHAINAMGIEAQTKLTEEARKLDFEWEYTVKKQLSESEISRLQRPKHYNIFLSSSDQLNEITEEYYGLIGLHPCGDLGPLLIKHFVGCDRVKFICVVGCCYMKLTCEKEPWGYPMSEHVKKLDHTLSYTVREISCHAIETYCERLCRGDYENLKIHAYRAALEKLLTDIDPKLRHTPIRSIKHVNTMSFERYLELATERLALPPLDGGKVRQQLSQWQRVVALYSLRLMVAPLVETIVLLDRVLYILENGLQCEIRSVFDPKISPRNHIIIGRR